MSDKAADVPQIVPGQARTVPRDYVPRGGLPYGTTAEERARNIDVFKPGGERVETPIPAERMPPVAGGYDARFPPGEGSLIRVPSRGLQPGERPGDPPIPRGA